MFNGYYVVDVTRMCQKELWSPLKIDIYVCERSFWTMFFVGDFLIQMGHTMD